MSPVDANAYAGDVSVQEAFQMLEADPRSVLVDVRTEPEWQYVGAPDLSGVAKDVLFLSWHVYPSMRVPSDFVERLVGDLRMRGGDEASPVLFLCRSGARSRSAALAMTRAGWSRCFNIADGFEGPADGDRHRGVVGGWKAGGLPWRQG